MSLFRRSTQESVRTPGRPRAIAGRTVTAAESMTQSVVWAARRLRADLISQLPVDVYSKASGSSVPVVVPPPPLIVQPSTIADGVPMDFGEWMYSGQQALDGHGNSFGIIRATDSFGRAARVDLVQPEDVTIRIKDGKIVTYRICGEVTDPKYVWHERQFTVPGLPIGLSPIAHAALALAGSVAALEFAVDWFANGAAPAAHLKNSEQQVDDEEADKIRARYEATVQTGGVLVTGRDWTYSAIAAKAAESGFIEQMNYSDVALARFYGVPADLVDVAVQSSTISYANITQRNLQLLVMNLGAAITRRERALTAGTCTGNRYVKLNRNAILAMDARTRAELNEVLIRSRQRTPDQVRQKDDELPLTEADYAQFERLFPARTQAPATQPQGGN